MLKTDTVKCGLIRFPLVIVLVLGLSTVSLADFSLDLTTSGSSGVINDAIFMEAGLASTGTGVIQSFVRLQANGTEAGYNTDGALEFDTKSGSFTHSLLLSDVPVVNMGGTDYLEFGLDINENVNSYISLDQIEIYLAATGSQTSYPTGWGTPIWQLDAPGTNNNEILLDYTLHAGSGSGDMYAYIPSSLFTGGDYVYLYSEFGASYASDGGFEEWFVKKEADTPPVVPVPGAFVLGSLGLGTVGAVLRRRKNRR